MNKILVVDDDIELRTLLKEYLTASAYQVKCVENGQQFWDILLQWQADIVILDVMLLKENGLDILHKMRQQAIMLPVLILSAKGDVKDRIVGLELGASDYLAKPFEPRELLIRIRNLLYQQEKITPKNCTIGNYTFDITQDALYCKERCIELTGAEINLLKLLCQHRGTVLSRDFLTRSLKGHDYMPFDRSIDVMIARLRKKLASSSFSQEFIRTIWGKGYQLVIDHQHEAKT